MNNVSGVLYPRKSLKPVFEDTNIRLVFLASVLCLVTQHSFTLRDETKNGGEGGQHEALGTYSLVGWLLIRLKERETAAKAEIEKQGDRESQCDKQGEYLYTDGQTDLVARVARYRDR